MGLARRDKKNQCWQQQVESSRMYLVVYQHSSFNNPFRGIPLNFNLKFQQNSAKFLIKMQRIHGIKVLIAILGSVGEKEKIIKF